MKYTISYAQLRDNPLPGYWINFGFESIYRDLRERKATTRLWHDYENSRVILESDGKPKDSKLAGIEWTEIEEPSPTKAKEAGK